MGGLIPSCSKTEEFFPDKYSQEEDVSNQYKIILKADLCGNWTYESDARNVRQFCNYLQNKGYYVKLELNPKWGCFGEFYVFKVKKNEKIPIFSNSSRKHPNALIGYNIRKCDYEELHRLISL